MKKDLVFLLIGTFLFLPSTEASFLDVPKISANSEAILYVQSQGLVQGYSDGTYRPEAKINRYDFIKIIVSARFSLEEISACDTAQYSFSDVLREQWFTPYVCTAKKNGIISGFEDGTFRGEENITLYEAIKIVLEAYGTNLSAYEGANQQWYEKYVNAAQHLGLLDTLSHNANDIITRGDMAKLIFVMENKTTKTEETGKEKEKTGEDFSDSIPETVEESFRYEDYSSSVFNRTVGTRPVAVFFYANWCPTCRALDKLILENVETLPRNAILFQADYDAEGELKQEYGVTSQSTIVFFDSQGNMIAKIINPSLAKMIELLDR